MQTHEVVVAKHLISLPMPHVSSELVYGSLEMGGLLLPPSLVGVALLQLPLYPQQLGLVAFLHHTTQHRRVVTTHRYV